MIRLRRMRRRATEPAAGFDDLRQAIGASAPILWSSEARHPVTFGLFDPVVLLPVVAQGGGASGAARRGRARAPSRQAPRLGLGRSARNWSARCSGSIRRCGGWCRACSLRARRWSTSCRSWPPTRAARISTRSWRSPTTPGLTSSPAFSARRHLFYRVMLLSKEGEMSSIRVALGSLVLMLALGAGSWEAVKAFPLHGGMEEQAPPRDPISAEQYHRTAVQRWETVQRDTDADDRPETPGRSSKASRPRTARWRSRPDYVDALVYKNILLRMQAVLSDDPQEVSDLIKQADELRSRALTLRADGAICRIARRAAACARSRLRAMPPPPPPSPPPHAPEFQALIDQYRPIRVGGSIKAPAKTRDVKPVYPPIARDASVQGVVILEALIDADGRIVDARVLRSIPLLDEAALDAVQQWRVHADAASNGVPRRGHDDGDGELHAAAVSGLTLRPRLTQGLKALRYGRLTLIAESSRRGRRRASWPGRRRARLRSRSRTRRARSSRSADRSRSRGPARS